VARINAGVEHGHDHSIARKGEVSAPTTLTPHSTLPAAG
jgi:hypothetical protein